MQTLLRSKKFPSLSQIFLTSILRYFFKINKNFKLYPPFDNNFPKKH